MPYTVMHLETNNAMKAALKSFLAWSRWVQAASVLAPILLGISAWLHWVLPAQADKAWLLHVARQWLEGKQLYVDVVEVNPPFVVWLYALPVWLSNHIPGLPDYSALAGIGIAASLVCAALGTRLIRLHPAFANDILRQAEFALLQALVFVFFTTQLYFFDRDHIFLVMIFPYLLRFMPSLAEVELSLLLRFFIGLMAAVGFCIKPHTVVVFAALQIFALLRTRTFAALLNVENAVIVSAALIYLCSALILIPDYFRVILLLAVATYSDFGNFGSNHAYLPPVLISLGLVFAEFRPRFATPYRRDVYYFAGACLAFLIYALVNNGWGYTYNPLYCMTIFTTGWMLWDYAWLKREHVLRRLPVPRASFGMRGCVLVLLLHTAYISLYLLAMGKALPLARMGCGEDEDCWRKEGEIVNYVRDHQVRSFSTLSLDFSRWAALLHMPDVTWEARFNCMWMLPKLIHEGEPYIASHRWIVDYVGEALADNLNRARPDTVFVDSSPGFLGEVRRFSYIGFFSRVFEFKEAWSHYRYVHTIDTCLLPAIAMRHRDMPSECKYDVYRRTP